MSCAYSRWLRSVSTYTVLACAGLLVLVGACSDPSYQSGIECGPSGECPGEQVCAETNQCYPVGVCPPELDFTFCSRLGAGCTSITNVDNCGTMRSVDCTCSAYENSQCGADMMCTCDANTCTAERCGIEVDDGCGGSLDCGNPCVAACSASGVCANVAEIAAGRWHTCARFVDGTMTCWGSHAAGQLGSGTEGTDLTAPAAVLGLSNVVGITAGDEHTCALLGDRTVTCWGRNSVGQLGIGLTGSSIASPRTTPVLTEVAEISAGANHTCARLIDGGVKCWGDNEFGQLGTGSTGTDLLAPPETPVLSGVAQISAGDGYTCARLTDGGMKCWGNNDFGQLGIGTSGEGSELGAPPAMSILSGVAEIAAGELHTCARLTDGTMKCWGKNFYGQLGDGNPGADLDAPAAASVLSNVAGIAVGLQHTCALFSDGALKCWGGNSNGELGIGSFGSGTELSSPPATAVLGNVSQVSVDEHTCALLTDGSMQCWGFNREGQVGDGTKTRKTSPTPVSW